MNQINCKTIAFLALLWGVSSFQANAQADTELYNTCAAIFLGQDRVVNEVSPHAVSEISKSANGQFSIREDLTAQHKNGMSVPFRVAIKKKKYNTLYTFSETVYTALDVESVLAACEVGDTIIFLLEKGKWAMVPNGEIVVTE